jgi:hypothetical protein
VHIRSLSLATAVDFLWVIGGLGWHWRGIGGLAVPAASSRWVIVESQLPGCDDLLPETFNRVAQSIILGR